MKQFFYFNVLILCSLFWGCTTTNVNPPQNIQQTCNAAPINNNNENQEKQCCLKDTLVVKRAEEVCSLNDSKDSVSDTSSSNISISPSVSLDNRKSNEYHGRFDYQKGEVNDSREGCFGANCQVNNVLVVNTKKKDFFDFFKDACQSLNDYIIEEDYLLLIASFFGALLALPLILLVPSFRFFKNIYALRKLWDYLQKKRGFFSFVVIFFRKILTNVKKYNILSPTESAENFSPECETFNQLKFAIIDDNPDIKNIAITGPYGSGKSSVWKTFHKITNLPKFKNIVEISLAKFNDPNEGDLAQTFNEIEIERAIIQQFVFSKRSAVLKYSNFPRINNLTDLKTTFLAVFLFTVVSLVLPLVNDTVFCMMQSWLNQPFQLETIYVPITLFFLYVAIYFVIQKVNKMKISKICLKDVEVTLGANESLFNKYINEIVYFFEATKCNCVVIEDLDRFDSLRIFSKLRELNNLINNYPATKKKVKFIYLVRDEILTGHERTKFFDFIIPVVPILNGDDNAIQYIKDHYLREDPFDYKNRKPFLKDSYLREIKQYLNDLRLVKNSFNELMIYRELNGYRMHGEDGDEKIFSLILYKNRYPKDFQNLQNKKGVLYYCLNQAMIDFDKENSEADRINYFSQIYSKK